MRIGIDCREILDPTRDGGAGIPHYVHHLVTELVSRDKDNEYVLFFDNHAAAQAKHALAGEGGRVTVRMLPFRSLTRHMPFVYSHIVVSSVFERAKLDLLHGPANVLPLFYRKPAVVTIHDLAIYDHPEWFPGTLPGARTFSTRVVVPRSMRAARRIIAVSDATKREIVRIFREDAGKVDVVREGVDATIADLPLSVAEKYGLQPGRFLLFLGTLEPRKNIPVAVRAFVRAVSSDPSLDDVTFALAGAKGWKHGPIFAAMREANAVLGRERVHHLGYVPAADKTALLASAAAFVFPSLHEGFGLPPLEAMAAGAPVICSDAGALPEVVGDAAILVPPDDEEKLARAMGDILCDAALRQELSRKGRERASSFSWARTATGTIAVYKRALA